MKGVLNAAVIDDIYCKKQQLVGQRTDLSHVRETKINSDIRGESPLAPATANLFPVFISVKMKY